MAAKLCCISALEPRDHSSPLTLASMVNAAEHLRNVRAGEPSALQFDI
jgi:hypothetical protein